MLNRRAYASWYNACLRCEDPRDKEYQSYGARGIVVCDRWQSFENFVLDMGDRPPGRTLDRIDNDGPYSPENCRWATAKEQCRNRRSNRFYELNGERRSLAEWCEVSGVKYDVVKQRLRIGWSFDRALTAKVRSNSRTPATNRSP